MPQKDHHEPLPPLNGHSNPGKGDGKGDPDAGKRETTIGPSPGFITLPAEDETEDPIKPPS